MFQDLKKFVSSEYCLSCRGCCIFQREYAAWGPHLAPDEAREILQLGYQDGVSPDGKKVVVREDAGQYHCTFLNADDHHCRVYEKRPFECRLYPFVISSGEDHFRLYAHLACPFVLEQLHSPQGEAYVAYLKTYFDQPERLALLRSCTDVFPDYSRFHDQIETVFDIAPRPDLPGEEISRWLSRRPRALSAMSFVNLFAWQDFFTYRLEEIAGNLCVFADQPVGTFLYWPPLGDRIAPEAIEECFRRMRLKNKGGSLTRIENVSRQDLAFFDPARYDVTIQGHEYVYYRRDVAELKGDGYKARRHDINAFIRANKPSWRKFTSEDMAECLKLFDRWLDKRHAQHEDDTYRYLLEDNRAVHRLVMEHAGRLGLFARVVEVNGTIVAYTFGYPLGENVFCDLFEITDPAVDGLSAYVFREFCADAELKGFSFINAMDDFGMPDVKKAKLSYRPVMLEPVYAVTEKKDV